MDMHYTKNLDFDDLKQVLDKITSRLVEKAEPGALYNAVVQIAMETTGAQASSLYLETSNDDKEKAPQTITMVAGAGYESYRIGKAVYKKGQGLTGWIWQQSKSVKYDTPEELQDQKSPWRGDYDRLVREKDPNWVCWSLIGIPLKLGERTIGVLKVENKNPSPPAHFTLRDQLVLDVIASTIALAIENRRISEEYSSTILNALLDVSETLISKEIMPFQVLCDRIVQECIRIFNAQACSLYLEKSDETESTLPQTITMVAGAGYEVYRIGKASYKKGQGLTGGIWEGGEPVKFDTTEELRDSKGPWSGEYDDIVREKDPSWVCSSLIGVPLRIGTRIIGVLKVENKNPSPQSHFTYEELRSLEILSSNIALVLEMLNYHREIFWRGDKARTFAHNLANQIRNALLNVHEVSDNLRHFPQTEKTDLVRKRLKIVSTTLAELEELRKTTLTSTPTRYRRIPMTVKDLLNDLLARSQRVLEEKRIRCIIEITDESVYVNVDHDQILQALGNIMTNAIDAVVNMPSPKIWIKVETHPAGTKNEELEILILDNGEGLTEDQRVQFKEARMIKSTKHQHIGAGLAEASRCCEDNEGRLECIAMNDDDIGGAFKIILSTCKPKPRTLLIIDDDKNVLDSFRIAVEERQDIRATYLETADPLLSQLGSSGIKRHDVNLGQFDWIFLDCILKGGIDGSRIYSDLLKKGNDLTQRILLMSGHEDYLDKSKEVYDKYEVLKNFDETLTTLYAKGKP